MSTGAPVENANLNGSNGITELTPIATGPFGGDSTYVINAQTQVFFGIGQAPSIYVLIGADAVGTLDCLVSGYASSAGPLPGGQPAPYQQSASPDSCSSGVCSANFPPVAAETLISQVTCYIAAPSAAPAYAAYLWNGAASRSVQDFFAPVPYGAQDSFTYYAIDAQTQMVLSSGQTPSITVDDGTGTIAELDCTVSGYTLPQQVAR
jgi:hypothetical protein